MRRTDAFVLAVVLCGRLSACSPTERSAAPERAATSLITTDPSVAQPAPVPPVEAVPVTEEVDGNEGSPAAARQVVRDYYAAIGARDYARAYAMWSDDGAASEQSFEHFRDGYANTGSVRATVGEAQGEEGAAGSRYIQVPIELVARQRDGSQKHYRGRFTLRALMADGASGEQRHWHLASADIQRIPD